MTRFEYNPRWPAIELGDNAVLDARDRQLEQKLAELGIAADQKVTLAEILELFVGTERYPTRAELMALFQPLPPPITVGEGDARYELR